MECEESNSEEREKSFEEKKLSQSANAKKQRRKRERKARESGRDPGIIGRPPVSDKISDEAIYNIILGDADQGIFHDVKWLQTTVSYFFMYLYIFF
jgi:hypothetical protein